MVSLLTLRCGHQCQGQAEGRHVAHRRTGTTAGVAPRSVRLTSPERVLFPDEGITKQDLFEYYRAIAPVLVPHLRNRPFTMKRSPYGVAGEVEFQKLAPHGVAPGDPHGPHRTHPAGRQRQGHPDDLPLPAP